MIILAAAFGLNHELGRESGVPLWDLPDEYNRFRKSIEGYPIIIGRKSYDVIGNPIPGSLNIVITRNKNYQANGALVVNSLKEALERSGDSNYIYIIGGGFIFNMALEVADQLEVSRIDATFPEATAFFPPFEDSGKWELDSTEKHPKDSRHAYSFQFEVWRRKNISLNN